MEAGGIGQDNNAHSGEGSSMGVENVEGEIPSRVIDGRGQLLQRDGLRMAIAILLLSRR